MMQQQFRLAYGRDELPVTISGRTVTTLLPNPSTPLTDLPAAFRAAVEQDVIGAAPLRTLVGPEDEITIVISDLTRAWMHQERIVPLLVDYLCGPCGVPPAQIVILIALGTHRGSSEEEKRQLVTSAVYDRVRVLDHDAQRCTYVGTTSFGTPVSVSPWVLGRKVILMGGTVHHLLAGYGGGRKSILPGVSSEETIQRNHSMALDPVLPRSSSKVGLGLLEDNPVHLDMLEACRMVAPIFGINLVVDEKGRHVALPSGDPEQAWLRSTEVVRALSGVPIAEKVDAVVVSCGGFPKDINLYQSSKTLINAFQAVKAGGEIVLLDQCSEGGGPAAFFDWIASQEAGTLDRDLRAHFTIAGYIFYAICEMAAHARIRILCELPEQQLAAMHMEKLAALPAHLDFGDASVLVMPFGGATVPMEKP